VRKVTLVRYAFKDIQAILLAAGVFFVSMIAVVVVMVLIAKKCRLVEKFSQRKKSSEISELDVYVIDKNAK
jgi:hypothetical protein